MQAAPPLPPQTERQRIAESVVFRTYQASDHEGCLAAFMSNVPAYFAASEVPEFQHFLATPLDGTYLVAELHGRIVGCGGWCANAPGVGRLTWGLVHRDCHGMAMGAALLRARLESLFADEAMREVGIDTSQHSAGFFARYGFVRLEEVEDGIAPGLHLVRMQLRRSDWAARSQGARHG
ncbi:MAG: GNAT family N-acetyltransferase [Proteobacteria bacterium]|nr:GNAT family N-acetyltransferase [Pseudomonadota bacterium]